MIEADTGHLPAHFCLGVLVYHKGDFEQAVDHFGKVHAERSRRPIRRLRVRGDPAEAGPEQRGTQGPGTGGRPRPGLRLGLLQPGHALQPDAAAGEGRADPEAVLASSNPRSWPSALTEWSRPTPGWASTPWRWRPTACRSRHPRCLPRLACSSRRRSEPIDCPLQAWSWAGGKVSVPGIAVGDLDGDGDQDMVLAGAGGERRHGGALSTMARASSRSAQRLADKGVVPCLGDIDNDGDLDLWLGRAGQDLLFLNDGKGKLTQAPDAARAGGRISDDLRPARRPGQRRRPRPAGDADQERLACRPVSNAGRPPRARSSTTTSTARSPTSPRRRGSHSRTCRSPPSSPTISTTIATSIWRSFSSSSPPLCWENFRVGRYRLLDAKATHLDVARSDQCDYGQPLQDRQPRSARLQRQGAGALPQSRSMGIPAGHRVLGPAWSARAERAASSSTSTTTATSTS